MDKRIFSFKDNTGNFKKLLKFPDSKIQDMVIFAVNFSSFSNSVLNMKLFPEEKQREFASWD